MRDSSPLDDARKALVKLSWDECVILAREIFGKIEREATP